MTLYKLSWIEPNSLIDSFIYIYPTSPPRSDTVGTLLGKVFSVENEELLLDFQNL